MAYCLKNLPIFILVAAAATLLFLKVPFAVENPFFEGDSGVRLENAEKFIVAMGNRVWLPFLQAHIWFLYNLKTPYYFFNLIPCLYFFLALLFIGKYMYRINGRKAPEVLFLLLMMFSLAYQRAVSYVSVNLYQEIPAMALFFILLYLGAPELKKSGLLLAVAAIALVTRDDFWVYLFVISLLNYKKIISDKGYRSAFIFLWSIVILWFCAVPFGYIYKLGRWPQFPFEWPLMLTSHNPFMVNLADIGLSIMKNRVHYLILALILLWIIRYIYFKSSRIKPVSDGMSAFGMFSAVSLTIIYLHFILFGAWYPSKNLRTVMPLLSHLCVWVMLFYKDSSYYPRVLKISARLVLAGGVLLIAQLNTVNITAKTYSDAESAYLNIKDAESRYPKDRPLVCIAGPDTWVSRSLFIAPTLYMNRQFTTDNKKWFNKYCDIIITPTEIENGVFFKHAGFTLRKKQYLVYFRK